MGLFIALRDLSNSNSEMFKKLFFLFFEILTFFFNPEETSVHKVSCTFLSSQSYLRTLADLLRIVLQHIAVT